MGIIDKVLNYTANSQAQQLHAINALDSAHCNAIFHGHQTGFQKIKTIVGNIFQSFKKTLTAILEPLTGLWTK